MKALLLTDLLVYGVLLVASYLLVFRRRAPELVPARVVVVEHQPAPEPPLPAPPPLPEAPAFHLRPWWTLPTSVETSP